LIFPDTNDIFVIEGLVFLDSTHGGNLIFSKFEAIVPVFFGCLGSLIISASIMQYANVSSFEAENQGFSQKTVEESTIRVEQTLVFAQSRSKRPDFILEQYRDPQAQSRVVDFFAGVCDSPEVAEAILANAEEFDVPPALAAALAWEESRFDPSAVNTANRNDSIDRGLFQLNNRTFPRLEIQAFFNPDVNAQHGMRHLRYCLDTGGTEVAGLAMYNAGANRVNSAGTPKSTLDYASRILNNRWEIESLFREQEALYQEQLDTTEIAEAKPKRPRLVPLMPLTGR
jgi:hypothetical protein